MTNFGERRDKIITKHEKELAKELQELETEKALYDILPVRPSLVFIHKDCASIDYEVKDAAEALSVFESFKPHVIPYLSATGGTFAHVEPEALMEPKDLQESKDTKTFTAPYLHLDKLEKYQTKASLRFYISLGTFGICRIECRLTQSSWNIISDLTYYRGEVSNATHTYPRDLQESKRIVWASGGRGNTSASYFFTEESFRNLINDAKGDNRS